MTLPFPNRQRFPSWLAAPSLLGALLMTSNPSLARSSPNRAVDPASPHPTTGKPSPRWRETACVFTKPREEPLRRGDVERIAASDETPASIRFHGAARPGEFFVFQIGVAAKRAAGPLGLTFTDLKRDGATPPDGAPSPHAASIYRSSPSISRSSLRCLSLGGVGSGGRPLAKRIDLPEGGAQVLWVGIDVPPDAGGRYAGSARLCLAPGVSATVPIALDVSGEPLPDRGAGEARRLSRLRWLDSTAGSEPGIPEPFLPVRTNRRSIRILGREILLGPGGLPERIASFFSPANTAITGDPRGVLARPLSFAAVTGRGPAEWRHRFGRIRSDGREARWTARSRADADGLRLETAGRLDCTGSGEIRVRLIAERDVTLEDARLEAGWNEEAARYFMGLHHPGGRRPDRVRWKWDTRRRQDCFWMGAVNAGLMLRFKDAGYVRPPVNIYYAFRPLRLPESWGNAGRGGIDIGPAEGSVVPFAASGGPRSMKRGETLDFVFEIYVTPFRAIDTDSQWATRFIHLGGMDPKPIDDAVASADPARGPNVINIHHASRQNPYINYPTNDDSFPLLRDLVRRTHDRGARLRIYYTTREITANMPELIPLHSMNGEIVLPGPGRDARTLLHPNGPHPWLVENLGDGFIPAWEAKIGPPYADLDLSVLTNPDSRWNNFYLEGLKWLVEKAGIDGVYIDDTALDATSLLRARRILDATPGPKGDRPPESTGDHQPGPAARTTRRLIDLHSWNHFNEWAGFANNLTIYMEILPYIDRLWLGEGFDAGKAAPDYWLVEMSGLPFGGMAEMLDGANPWRGLVFGETARLPWSGDPREIWRVWDEFGMRGVEFLPWFAGDAPVRTDREDVLATVYRGDRRALVAVASWAAERVAARLAIDWNALGIDPAKARITAPAMKDLQEERRYGRSESIPIEPGRGALLLLDENNP